MQENVYIKSQFFVTCDSGEVCTDWAQCKALFNVPAQVQLHLSLFILTPHYVTLYIRLLITFKFELEAHLLQHKLGIVYCINAQV